VGAWIETLLPAYNPTGGVVAPRVGAWIETAKCHDSGAGNSVAPRVGAWIETAIGPQSIPNDAGRPPRGGVD